MGFLSKVFGGKASGGGGGRGGDGDEHAVLVYARLSDDSFGTEDERAGLHALQDGMERAVAEAGAGQLDGDEFGGGFCTIFLYGPDAERLWGAVAPVLERRPFRKGSYALKRFGGPDCGRQERINLHWDG